MNNLKKLSLKSIREKKHLQLIGDTNCDKCNSTNLIFVKYEMKNKVLILRKQCFDCGRLLTLNYKRNIVENFKSLPFADLKLRDENRNKSILKSDANRVLFYYANIRFEKQKEYYRNVYLKSDEWKHKRQVIMDYYNWKCLQCGEYATDLHHKTYENIFKEKFEDLEPLCRSCHENEHNIN